jgi:hypothetical protein
MDQIESILVNKLRPTFLALNHDKTTDNPFIHVVVSAKVFNRMNIDQRIATVFNYLLDSDKDLVEKNTIIVEAFNSTEMADVFEHIR